MRQNCIISKVNPMIEKEQDYEKEIVERVKREIIEEKKKKKGKSLKLVGLIISGVGGLLYLVQGLIFLFTSMGYYYNLWRIIPLFIAGAISQTGTIVAISKVKIGGAILLTSIPIAFVIGIILSFAQPYYYPYYNVLYVFQYILFPLPLPHSAHVIAGAILCLIASDNEVRE